ncbi:MAG: P-loop NTPase fold protein [Ignavibacteria bacterium]|nr:P-loop NTPase fold protein [Ignavibacteria bacterium]
MENIVENLKTYLTTNPTDYALLINGEWGSGKTYFIKNKIFPIVNDLSHKPIYISLNGISEINQLEQSILLELIKLPGDNKISQTIFSSVGEGIKKLSGFFSKGYFKLDITKLNLVSLIPLNNKILFFDDLERISPKIGLDEILGYINSNFVEHKSVKVIIIGDLMRVKDQDKLKSIKEKLISREFKFAYTSVEIWQLVVAKYSSNAEFILFLNENKNNIKTLIEAFNVNNLRIIFFFTETLKKIFPLILSKKKNLAEEIILFTLIITLEFKKGSFHEDEPQKRKELIEVQSNILVLGMLEDQSGELPSMQSYARIIYKTYLKQLKYLYHFYYSIYSYIVYGVFNEDYFRNDFGVKIQDEYVEAVHRLKDIYTLSEDDVKISYNKVLEGLSQGVFNVYTHQYVFDTLYPLIEKNIITLSIPELKSKIVASLEIAKKRNEFDQYSFDYGDFYSRPNQDSKDIFNQIKELHDSFYASKKELGVANIFTELGKENADYQNLFHSYANINLSEYITSTQILELLSKTTNYSITKFARFLAEKYRYDDYATIKDIDLIRELIAITKDGMENVKNSQLRKAVFEDFNRILITLYNALNKRITPQNNIPNS